jgi:hypothetical protein
MEPPEWIAPSIVGFKSAVAVHTAHMMTERIVHVPVIIDTADSFEIIHRRVYAALRIDIATAYGI